MFTFSSSEQYESFCKDVFESAHGYVDVQKYGRNGQKQDGIDLIGYRPNRTSRVGIQCKWYDKVTSTLRNITDKDIIAARAIEPPITHLYICVDAAEDRDLTNLVARRHDENMAMELFPITLIFRDDFHGEARKIPTLIEKYVPDTFQAIRKAAVESVEADFAQTLVNDLQVKGLPLQAEDIGLRPKVFASRIAASAEAFGEQLVAANEELQSLVRLAEDAIAVAQPEKAVDYTARALAMGHVLSSENRAAVFKLRGRAFASCNQIEEAIKCYEQYLELHPSAPDAPARRAFVAFLKGDIEDMRRLANDALKIEGSADLALGLLIDNCESDAHLEPLLSNYSNLLNTSVTANLSASMYFFERMRYAEAVTYAKRAMDLQPGDLRNKCHYAMCRLLETLPADDMTRIGMVSADCHQAAEEVEKIFGGLWLDVKEAADEQLIIEVARFYGTALIILGRTDNAVDLVNSIPKQIQSERLALLRAHLMQLIGDTASANEILGHIDDPELVVRAKWLRLTEAISSRQVDEALGLIDELSGETEDVFRREGLQYQKALLLLELRADEAMAVATRLGKEDASPSAKIYAAHLLTLLEDKETANILATSALEAIKDGALVDRDASLLAAQFAKERGLLIISVQCLGWAENSANDNSALRLLLRTLSQLGQWNRVESIITALPESVRNIPFYIEIEARRCEAAGQTDKALVLLDGYADPTDQGFYLAVERLQLLIRQDRKGHARAAAGDLLRRVVTVLSQDGEYAQKTCRSLPHVLPKLVKLGTSLGHEELALQAAMLSLSVFLGLPSIELMYSFATLHRKPNQISELSVGSSARIQLSDGRIAYLVVCPDGTDLKRFLAQFPLAYSLTASEAATVGLLGITAGVQIHFDSRDGSLAGEIMEIVDVHFTLHGLIFNTFEERYPGQRALQKISIETKEDGSPDFSAIFSMLNEIDKIRSEAFNIYKNNPVFPLVLVAQLFKMAPMEFWEQIVGAPGRYFYTWEGSLNELDRQVSALPDAPTLVVEPLTLVSWRRLGKLELLMRLPGRILIAPSTLDFIQKQIEAVEGLRNTVGSLSKVGDKYVRHETNPQEIEEMLNDFRNLKRWIEIRCEIVDVAADTSNNELFSLIYQACEATAHAIKLAQQESALLWVDDLRLAKLAEHNSWASCVCWQVLFEALVRLGKANEDEVAETLAVVTRAKYTFAFVKIENLCAAAKNDQLEVEWKTRALLNALRQPDVDWNSSMRAFLKFIDKMFQSNIVPACVVSNYVTIGLSAITNDATRFLQETLSCMAEFPSLAKTVDKWKQGHFII